MFRDLYIGVDPDWYVEDDSFMSDFAYETFGLGHFLTRELRALKIEHNYCARLLVDVGKVGTKPDAKIFEKSLRVRTSCDFDNYFSLTTEQKQELQCKLVENALEHTPDKYRIPKTEILSLVNKYRAGGYVNEWLFKKKKYRNIGLLVEARCKITLNSFYLTLIISNSEGILFHDEVIKTPPDSIHFHHLFKDIKLDGSILYIEARSNSPTGSRSFELDVSKLAGLQ